MERTIELSHARSCFGGEFAERHAQRLFREICEAETNSERKREREFLLVTSK